MSVRKSGFTEILALIVARTLRRSHLRVGARGALSLGSIYGSIRGGLTEGGSSHALSGTPVNPRPDADTDEQCIERDPDRRSIGLALHLVDRAGATNGRDARRVDFVEQRIQKACRGQRRSDAQDDAASIVRHRSCRRKRPENECGDDPRRPVLRYSYMRRLATCSWWAVSSNACPQTRGLGCD